MHKTVESSKQEYAHTTLARYWNALTLCVRQCCESWVFSPRRHATLRRPFACLFWQTAQTVMCDDVDAVAVALWRRVWLVIHAEQGKYWRRDSGTHTHRFGATESENEWCSATPYKTRHGAIHLATHIIIGRRHRRRVDAVAHTQCASISWQHTGYTRLGII